MRSQIANFRFQILALVILLLTGACQPASQPSAGGLPAGQEQNASSQIHIIRVVAKGAETLAAAKARNELAADGCYVITDRQDDADAILKINSEKQRGSSPFTHILFTGQKIYTSARLFDRRTGRAIWATDRSDRWFGSPAKAGKLIADRLRKDRDCR